MRVECSTSLRPIVIDGSNVAMSHGNKQVFSCRGIKICVDWFTARGHKEITVFVPKWRKEASKIDNPIADQEILRELEKDRLLVFTPSRLVYQDIDYYYMYSIIFTIQSAHVYISTYKSTYRR